MKLIGRYIAFNFIIPFLISLIFFVLFLITFQLFSIVKLVINKGFSFGVVFDLFGHLGVSFIPFALPLAVLFASIYAANKLSFDSEFIAMKALGFSNRNLLMPFLYTGLLISSFIFVLSIKMIPQSKSEFQKIFTTFSSKAVLANIRSKIFFTDIPGVVLFANKVKDSGRILENVFIHHDGKDNKEERIIFAKKGYLEKKHNGKMVIGNFRLKLEEGNIIKLNEGDEVEKILFKSYNFPIGANFGSIGLVTRDSMRNLQELIDLYLLPPEKRKEILNEQNFIKLQLEMWSRFNLPILCLSFIFIGFVFGFSHVRSEKRNSGILCFIVLIIYYTCFFSGVALARKGLIWPSMAVFLPTVIVFLVGAKNYRQLSWTV